MQQCRWLTRSNNHVSDFSNPFETFLAIPKRLNLEINVNLSLTLFPLSWYRDGNPTPLQASVNRGSSKDHQTTSVLTITPTKDDDGARYRCVVFNRAMKEGEKYETTVTLSVNCKYQNNYYLRSNRTVLEDNPTRNYYV